MTSAELTIGEVAERTGLTRHTLHYYARDGLMLGVGRGGSGRRRYFEHDLGWIELITKLRRPACRSARSAATPSWSGGGNEDERLELLRAHRKRVRVNWRWRLTSTPLR